MEYRLTPDEVGIAGQAKEFALRHFVDGAHFDEQEAFPEGAWKAAAESGLLSAFIPKAYGGRGLGFLAHTLIMEEFWRVEPGMGNILLTVFGAELLMLFGNEEQRAKWLPLLASGKAISCCAVTEPDAGSDIFAIACTALPFDQGFQINGTKQFITSGNRADLIFVLTLTDPDARKKTNAFSFFMVEKDAPGLKARKMTGKLGIRASDTAEIEFRDVRVPRENLMGPNLGEGFNQVMHLFNINRVFACGQGVGVAQGALDMVVEHVRQSLGLSSSQIILYRIAEMATSVEAARRLTYYAGAKLDAGDMDPGLVAMAKLFAGETGVKVTGEALGMVGGPAASGNHRLARFYRDAKIVEIYEGAKDLEKLTIGRQIIGRR